MLQVLLFHLVILPKSGAGCVQYTMVSARLSLGTGLVLAQEAKCSKLIYPVRFHERQGGMESC